MRHIKTLAVAITVLALLAGGRAYRAQAVVLYSQMQIEQMVAPVALYPDALLSQVLMASTFPDEVTEADWWVRSNTGLSDYELDDALSTATWDPSVISLCKFPALLESMATNVQWTTDLGYAFLRQRMQVLDAVQRLRREAYRAGYLRSTPQQTVVVEPSFIAIRPCATSIVYVPVYDPAIVYGQAWSYPAYTYRSAWAPAPGTHLVNGFAWGVGFAIAHALFGGLDWGRHEVIVNKTVIVNNRIFWNTDYYRNRDRYGGTRHPWVRPAQRASSRIGNTGAPYGGRQHGAVRGVSRVQPVSFSSTGKPSRSMGKAQKDLPSARTVTPSAEPARRYEPVRAGPSQRTVHTDDRARQAGPQTNVTRGNQRSTTEAQRVSRSDTRPVQARPAQPRQSENRRDVDRGTSREQAHPARASESGKKVKADNRQASQRQKRS